MATTLSKGPTFESILSDVKEGKLKPAYLLMGVENYYIEKLSDAIIEATLPEEERDFNLHVFYGNDSDINSIVNAAQSFPMGSEHSLVIVKEAQDLKDLENISYYLQNPQPTTVLLLQYKNGTADRRKKFVSQIASLGVVFESAKISDVQLPTLVRNYAQEKGRVIDEKSVSLIAESIGSNLIRLYGEMDKLFLTLPQGVAVTPELVEKNIGISKDFNFFELQNALVEKNAYKAFQIIKYFDKNPKANPIQMTLPMLFSFFSNLMMAYYAPQKTIEGIASYLGQRDWQVRKNIYPAMRNYTAKKVLDILGEIKCADEKSKGVGGSKVSSADILKQLIAFILQ